MKANTISRPIKISGMESHDNRVRDALNRTRIVCISGAIMVACLMIGSASAAVSDFVGVSVGDEFRWTVVMESSTNDPTGMPYMDEQFPSNWSVNFVGTARILRVDEVNETLVEVVILRTLTYRSSSGLNTNQVDVMKGHQRSINESFFLRDDVNINLTAMFSSRLLFINKNAANKTAHEEPSGIVSGFSTWNDDGVLERHQWKQRLVNDGIFFEVIQTVNLDAGQISGFAPALLAIAALLAVPMLMARFKQDDTGRS